MSDSLWFHGVHHTRLPLSFTISQTVFHCLSLSSLSFTNSLSLCSRLCPLSQWHHLTISSSVTHFSYCPQSFPASGSFPMSQLFTSCGQSIGASVSVSVCPVNIQGWFPFRLTGFISLLFKDSQESSPSPHFESVNSSVFRMLYGLTLTSKYDYWKKNIALTTRTFVSKV